VKQCIKGQTVGEADWLLGEDCFMPGIKGVGYRNMLHPGTAFKDIKGLVSKTYPPLVWFWESRCA